MTAAVLTFAAVALAGSDDDWPSAGGNVSDTHAASGTWAHSALESSWSYTAPGNVEATPAVSNGVVYFTDSKGYLDAVDVRTHQPPSGWTSPLISKYTNVPLDFSRTSPAVYGNTVYIGDAGNMKALALAVKFQASLAKLHLSADLLAFNASTGAYEWRTELDSNPWATLLGSPLAVSSVSGLTDSQGEPYPVVFEGVSSKEEEATADKTYSCCSFQGSIVAVNGETHQIVWKTSTVCPQTLTAPQSTWDLASCGYTGGAVFSSTAAYDPATNTLYVTTGNNYSTPKLACEKVPCLASSDHIDSLIALDAATGKIKWSRGPESFDVTNGSCYATTCPGFDWDFGTGPSLFTPSGSTTELVAAGGKDGTYFIWYAYGGYYQKRSVAIGPGGGQGGIVFGGATDGRYIFAGENNACSKSSKFPTPSYTFDPGTNQPGTSSVPTTNSSWAAIDPSTGKTVWQVADPNFCGVAASPLTVVGDVVFAPTVAPAGNSGAAQLRELSTTNGRTLTSFTAPAGTTWETGVAVAGGTAFWGAGATLYALVPSQPASGHCSPPRCQH